MKNFDDMSKQEKIEYWTQTESVLRKIFGKFKSEIDEVPPEYETEILDYLDHNELGLAFETLVFLAEQIEVSISIISDLLNVGKRMALDTSDDTDRALWDRLLNLSAKKRS
jgi:hypothetical protein